MATRTTKRAQSTTRQPTRKATRPATRATRPPDAIALIKADHAAVNQLFRRYKELGDRAYASRKRIADRVIKELSVHAAIEEQILYPNARAALPNGKKLVGEAIDEHQELKETLVELDKCEPDDARFDELMKQVREEVRHHVREEEASEGILGQLRKHASRDDLVQMAKLMKTAKKAAPTRPHPNAPSTPPGNVIIGAAAAVVDKARDAMGGRK
jgi:hemerythrin superfamily protein